MFLKPFRSLLSATKKGKMEIIFTKNISLLYNRMIDRSSPSSRFWLSLSRQSFGIRNKFSMHLQFAMNSDCNFGCHLEIKINNESLFSMEFDAIYYSLCWYFLEFIWCIKFQKSILFCHLWSKMIFCCKVEIFLEQREVAFLSPSKICENLNFSREIQIFANFAGW